MAPQVMGWCRTLPASGGCSESNGSRSFEAAVAWKLPETSIQRRMPHTFRSVLTLRPPGAFRNVPNLASNASLRSRPSSEPFRAGAKGAVSKVRQVEPGV